MTRDERKDKLLELSQGISKIAAAFNSFAAEVASKPVFLNCSDEEFDAIVKLLEDGVLPGGGHRDGPESPFIDELQDWRYELDCALKDGLD